MEEGSDPHGSDPSSMQADLERARLRIYRPDASAQDREVYERLVALAVAAAAPEIDELRDQAVPRPDRAVVVDRRPGPVATVTGVLVVGIVLLVLVLIPRGARPPAVRLDPPRVSGQTLAILLREDDPKATPSSITYQPAGYTVFQPAGRTVRVGIRCQGTGTVAVGAGERFVFHCGDGVQVFQQVGRSTTQPFVIIATTRGNVVWGARITVR